MAFACWRKLFSFNCFPVPQDNLVPVATSSFGLVGCKDTHRTVGMGAKRRPWGLWL